MTDTTVSNSQASSNPDIEVRTSTTAGGKEIQHVRLDLGVGTAEAQAEGTVPVSGTITANAGTNLNTSALALESGGNLATIAGKDFATQTTLAALNAKVTSVNTGAVVVSSSALPTGAATETTLSALNTKIPAQGQAAMAASVPVTIANNQSNVPVNMTQINGVTPSLNTGVRDAGTQRVTIATNDTLATVTTVSTVTNITNQGQLVDNAAFVDGTTRLNMAGYVFDETAGTALAENDGAAARVDSKRAQVFTLEDATTRGRRVTVNTSGQLEVNANRTFASINHGSKSFTTAGTAEALGGSTATTQIDIVANSTNTGTIWIGGSGVTAGNGRPLVPGQMYSVNVSNLSTVFGVSTVNGEGVSFTRFV